MVYQRKKKEEHAMQEPSAYAVAVAVSEGEGVVEKDKGREVSEKEAKKEGLRGLLEKGLRASSKKEKDKLGKSLNGYEEGRKIWELLSTSKNKGVDIIVEMCLGEEVGMGLCYGNWDMRDPAGVCQRCGVRGLCKES